MQRCRRPAHHPARLAQAGGWLSSRRKSADPAWTLTLHFWCLNPAVVFGAIGEAAHSVIVASGTLSPLSSFQSELGVPFPINLEASHVIKADQVRRRGGEMGGRRMVWDGGVRFWSFCDFYCFRVDSYLWMNYYVLSETLHT